MKYEAASFKGRLFHDVGETEGAGNPVPPLVQGTDRNFYGTTPWGGAYNSGTVFKITPAGTLDVVPA